MLASSTTVINFDQIDGLADRHLPPSHSHADRHDEVDHVSRSYPRHCRGLQRTSFRAIGTSQSDVVVRELAGPVNHHRSVLQGTSCAEFNSTVCVDSPDGTLWEDISSWYVYFECWVSDAMRARSDALTTLCSPLFAHSDTPFCHSTYIVCTNGLPTQFTCPNETVWSQANKTCINRADGPGKCPVRNF